MVNLHAHYHHGNAKAFRQELDGTASSNAGGSTRGLNPGSASGGRSWTFSGVSYKVDPNERDVLGRTVLHLAASSTNPQHYSFFQMLLKSPSIAVNLQDHESGYTALHRALFAGNVRAARDLLARSDTDVSVKDFEGLTAFDLYNGTVEGTNPPTDPEIVGTDLYTWGVNRNSTLGLPDNSDKSFPDRVNLLTQRQASDHPDPAERFFHVGVRDVKMAKLHTAAVSAEARGNLSICGFGSGGRLGRVVHSQLPLLPLPDLPHTITDVAVALDHTLALTSGGYILSWGNNKFSQLGYPSEMPEKPSPFAREGDELIQASPKRIIGPLKKEWVRGVAAGRMSSACWTADAVWTWGTNLGHLGYEKTANPVQVNPRKVTTISQPVIDVALTDYAMLCLLDTFEVLCFHHDAHFRINYSSPTRSLKAPKNPGQVTLDPNICKVTSCGQTFATLSQKGDVCTFTLPHPSEEASKDVRDRHVSVKPQVQWSLRKSFTAVRDMALGTDGTIIVCTTSGHVYVRQRLKAGSGQLKFRRVPYLQRVIKVAANESGAFAAIRVDARPTAIMLKGKTLEEDMFSLQPHIRRFENQMTAEDFDRHLAPPRDDEDEDEESSNSVARDTTVAIQLCTILNRWQASHGESLFAWSDPLLGSDVVVVVGEHRFPAHSVVLSLRSPVMAKLLDGKRVEGLEFDGDAITMDAAHPFVALLLLQYLYSDEMAAIWDSRVAYAIQTKFPDLDLNVGDIKADIRRLAQTLELTPLLPALNLAGKTSIAHALSTDLASFFTRTSAPPNASCDVLLVLADREVSVNSALLRARCPFFEAMFADRDWTLLREDDGRVVIDMAHLRWRPMKLVFRFIHEGREDDLFDYLHQETLDEFLDFVFEVLAAATELLMDRLVLVCSRVIAKHCNPFNAAALAVEASFYQATTLKRAIFDYIAACMETMLESGLLDDMDDGVLNDLAADISAKQLDKAVVPRSNILGQELLVKHRDWLALQDIPAPRVRAPQKFKARSPALVPQTVSPLATPEMKPLPAPAVDEIFTMDEEPASAPETPAPKGLVWKSRTVEVEKTDLRSIMAAEAKATPRRPSAAQTQSPSTTPNGTTPRAVTPAPPGSSPSTGAWRPVAAVTPASLATPSRPPPPTRAPGSMATAPAGVVITPQKAPTSSVTRRTGAAWATPTTFAPPPPSRPVPSPAMSTSSGVSSATQAMGLLAIQAEEVARGAAVQKGPPKSFAEIQAEEAERNNERAREEEFRRWWAEEESRNKSKSAAAGGASGASGSGGGRGKGKAKETKAKDTPSKARDTPSKGKRRENGDRGARDGSKEPSEADGREHGQDKEGESPNGRRGSASERGRGRGARRVPRPRRDEGANMKPASEARIDDPPPSPRASRGRGGGGSRGGRGKRPDGAASTSSPKQPAGSFAPSVAAPSFTPNAHATPFTPNVRAQPFTPGMSRG